MEDKKTKEDEHFELVCMGLAELHMRKNHDYGNAFGKVYQELMKAGQRKMADGYVVGMLSVKVNRVKTLLSKEESMVNEESVEDSLMDLASYAIMALIERNRK